MKSSNALGHGLRIGRSAKLWFGVFFSLPCFAANVAIEPSVSTRAAYSDNGAGSANGDSEFLMEVTPAIRISRNLGALTGGFSASLRNVHYLDDADRNTSFVTFQGRGQFEAIDDTLFIEASGSASRTDRSLFSAQTRSDAFSTDSRNETRVFTLAPRLQFQLGSTGSGQARVEQTWYNGGERVSGSSGERNWSLNLVDGRAFGPLGWSVDLNRTDTFYDGETEDVSRQSGRLGLSYLVTRRLQLRSTVGREKNDLSFDGEQSKTTYGFGGVWTPTPRTSLDAFVEERLYGRGYDVKFTHRSRRTAWSASFSRDYVSSSSLLNRSLTDYYYDLFYPNFLAATSDAASADVLTRQYLEFIGADNLPQEVTYVSESQSLRQSARLNMVVTGVRNSVTVALFRTQDERLSSLRVSDGGDFDGNDVVVRTGGAVSLAHKLSPKASLNSSFDYSNSKGHGANAREQRLTSYRLGLTRRLGAKANGSLNYTHTKREGDEAGDENQISATFGIRF